MTQSFTSASFTPWQMRRCYRTPDEDVEEDEPSAAPAAQRRASNKRKRKVKDMLPDLDDDDYDAVSGPWAKVSAGGHEAAWVGDWV